jgi:hypothetical protein
MAPALERNLGEEHPSLTPPAIEHDGGSRRPAIRSGQDSLEGFTVAAPDDDQPVRQSHGPRPA